MQLHKFVAAGATKTMVPLTIALLVGAVGSYLLVASHADSFPPSVSFGPTIGAKHYAPSKFTLLAGTHKLTFLQDGNLVATDTSSDHVLWSTSTNGQVTAGGYLLLQTDGRLAIYATHNATKPIWTSPYFLSGAPQGTTFTLEASGIGDHVDEIQSFPTANGTTTTVLWTVY